MVKVVRYWIVGFTLQAVKCARQIHECSFGSRSLRLTVDIRVALLSASVGIPAETVSPSPWSICWHSAALLNTAAVNLATQNGVWNNDVIAY